MQIDEHFIRRIYRTTAWVTAVGVLWCLGLKQPLAALGLVLGAAASMASFKSIECVVKRSLDPGQGPAARFPMVKYAFLKYPAYLLVMAPVVYTKNIPFILGFVFGLALVHFVIILKGIGQFLLQRAER